MPSEEQLVSTFNANECIPDLLHLGHNDHLSHSKSLKILDSPIKVQIKKEENKEFVPLIDRVNEKIQKDEKFFSLEYFPPRTQMGANNLLDRFKRMKVGNPLFCDVTWHSKGNPGGDHETSSMTIAGKALNSAGLDVMLHLTCINMTEEMLHSHLSKAKKLGIRSILALRGDLPDPKDVVCERFKHAEDMVRYIRETFGNYFTIVVAGYPVMHPESTSAADDLLHLKAKVDAGADFIITQLFFDLEIYTNFVTSCRDIGIKCPIIPGIMPIQSKESLRHIVSLTKLEVPEAINLEISRLPDDKAIQDFGIDFTTRLCRDLLTLGHAPGIHFYTMNKEIATVSILKALELWKAT